MQQGEAADVPAGPVLAELLPLPERVDRPERTLGIGGVAFAAEVAAPEAEVCPVVEVRQAPFTTERLRALAEAFCPGATLYHSWEQTQEELLRQRATLLEYGGDSEDAQIKLKWLDETIPTAPLTVEKVPFSWNEVPASGYLGIRAQREGGNFSTLHLGPHLFAYFRDGDHALLPKSAFTEREFSRFPAPEVTQEAAEAAAMEALALAKDRVTRSPAAAEAEPTWVFWITFPYTLAVVIFVLRKDLALLDVITLGKEQAVNLGVDYDRTIRRLLLGVTLCIAVATAMVGPISFLGLIIANLSRQLLKTFRHGQLILGSALFGMIVLVGGQLIVEQVFTYAIPVSVFITVGGGIYFLYLLLTNRRV